MPGSGNDASAAKRARVPQRGPEAPRFIVVEGPLRVGKSTLARILAERLHARRIYDCEDNPFLADFYKAKAGAAFRAQMYFLLERQKRLRDALAVEAPGLRLSPRKGPDFRQSQSRRPRTQALRALLRTSLRRSSRSRPRRLFASQAGSPARAHCQKSLARRVANLARVHRRSRPRLRTLLFPLLRFRSSGHQHVGNRLRRAQRRLAATPPPPSGSRQGHPILPPPRCLRVNSSSPVAAVSHRHLRI